MLRKALLFCFLPFLTVCSTKQMVAFFNPECSSTRYEDPKYQIFPNTSYRTVPMITTKGGIGVDTSGFNVDTERMDMLLNEFERCTGTRVDVCAFVVKIAPDWRTDCKGRQVFPCNDPAANKCSQMESGEKCTCGCTGSFQYPAILVTTPDLASFKHELVHVVFHAAHGDPLFRCEQPQ